MSDEACFNFSTDIVDKFDDPFLMYSSEWMPTSLGNAMEYCRYLYNLVPEYQAACSNVISHFITEFEFPGGGSSEEKADFQDYLQYGLRMTSALRSMGIDWACFGNAYYRVNFPFDRFLVDRRGNKFTMYSLDMFPEERVKFHSKECTYEVPDPRKNMEKTVKLPFVDRPCKDRDRISLVKIDPRYIRIRSSFLSSKNQYIYIFEEELKTRIKNNDLHEINNTPNTMLKALCNDEDFLFDDNEIFHFREEMESGLSNNGWGLSPLIRNFRNLHQLIVYKKADEAVALDFLLPFRLITPQVNESTSGFIMERGSMNMFMDAMDSMIKNKRKNPMHIQASPVPANYNEYGANGKQYTPKDLMEYQTDQLLRGMKVPPELINFSLQIQVLPTALRVFENNFWFMHEGFQNFVRWATTKIQRYMQSEYIETAIAKPSLADDIDRRNIKMQLGFEGELPRRAYLGDYGIHDPVSAKRERMEEDLEIEKMTIELENNFKKELETEMMMTGQMQGDEGGGDVTPMDLEQKAMQLAEEWLSIPSHGQRSQAMQQMKAQDYNLYAMASKMMEEIRRAGESQGRAETNAQYQQQ